MLKAIPYVLFILALAVGGVYTWLGTGLGDIERRLGRRIMGFYGRYGVWPRSVAELQGRQFPDRAQSLHILLEGRRIDFRRTANPKKLDVVVNGILPFSGRTFEVSCEEVKECERIGGYFFVPPPQPPKPGEMTDAMRWM